VTSKPTAASLPALLSHPGTRYQDLGPDYYHRQASTRWQIATAGSAGQSTTQRAHRSSRTSPTVITFVDGVEDVLARDAVRQRRAENLCPGTGLRNYGIRR